MSNSFKTLAFTGVVLYLFFGWLFYFYFQLGDDTYIYLQYVKNLLANGELAFNPGTPSYGFTAPLWLFLMALIAKITGHPLSSPAILSLGFGIASVVLWVKIIFMMTGDKYKKVFFVLLLVFDPNLLKHAWLGMEATGSFFFSSLLIYYIFIKKQTIHPSLFGLITGLFYFIRPESVLTSALMGIYLLHTKKFSFTKLTLSAAVSLLIAAPWFLYSYSTFGIFFPSTYYAKGGAYSAGSLLLSHLIDTVKILGGNYFIHLLLLIYVLIKSDRKDLHISGYYAVFSIAMMLCFYSLTINADIIYARYFCLFLPFGFYLALSILREESFKLTRYFFALPVSSLVILVFLLSSLHKASFISSEEAEDRLVAWVNINTAPDAKIVRQRIGKIAYKTDRTIVDPVGFVNPEIIPYTVAGNLTQYYNKVRPDYLIFSDDKYLKNIAMKSSTVVHELRHKVYPMVRDAFTEPFELKKIFVYRVSWN